MGTESLEGGLASVASGVPWSGGERNHVFFGGFPGHQFEDLSGITGIDDPSDGRSFALLDYDRDGWLDVALGIAGAPRLRLLRNRIGETKAPGGFVAVRFIGGNKTPEPSDEWSARDGFGTAVNLDLGDGTAIFREHQPESGFLAQHSSTMIVGIGDHDAVAAIRVRWLSGKNQESGEIPAGMLVTVYENPSDSPTGEPFTLEPYTKAPTALMTQASSPDFWRTRLLPTKERASNLVVLHDGEPRRSERGLTLITTMATWCTACVTELPEFRRMRGAFGEDELAMYSVPVDGEDTDELLQGWFAEYAPPYELLTGIAQSEVDKVNQTMLTELRADAVPATFVTDATGRVLIARWGVPSVSDLRKLLWMSGAEARMHGTNE